MGVGPFQCEEGRLLLGPLCNTRVGLDLYIENLLEAYDKFLFIIRLGC